MADVFEYYAGAANKHLGSVVPAQDAGLDVVLREPVGVCGLIVPWNFPLLIATWKLAPALACGNPVILKPASLTPRHRPACWATCWSRPACPPTASRSSPAPARPSATPSWRTPGWPRSPSPATRPPASPSCAHAVADNITRVSLELGGKSAAIVFADADLDAAAADAPYSVFANAGQDCCARSRASWWSAPSTTSSSAVVAERTGAPAWWATPLDEATEIGPDDLRGPAGHQRSTTSTSALARAPRWCAGGDVRAGAGLVPDPGGGGRRRQLHAHRPGGDLRAGGRRSSPSTTRTTRSASPTTATTACPAPLWTRDLGPGHPGGPAVRTGVLSVNTNRSVRYEAALRRVQAVRARPGARHGRAWTTTPRSRTCSSPPTDAAARTVRQRRSQASGCSSNASTSAGRSSSTRSASVTRSSTDRRLTRVATHTRSSGWAGPR